MNHNNKPIFFNTVTMQAQDTAPSDFPCNDKFLIQSTIVPKGIKEEQVQSSDLCNIQGNIDSRNIQHILTTTIGIEGTCKYIETVEIYNIY